MLSLCKDALKKNALVFVDEIGRLELNRGKGLAPLIPLLAQPRRGHTVVIVRDTLLDKLVAYVEPAQPRLVTLDDTAKVQSWCLQPTCSNCRQKEMR